MALLDRLGARRRGTFANASSWVGLVFVAVCYMYALWSSQMKHDPVDTEWGKSVHHYIRNEDDKSLPAGRYNAGQKLF
jgi:cytochrome b subunit of formate dehydrogenase